MLYIWLGLLILFGVIEALSFALTSVWFAFGSLVALISAALHAPLWLQIALFLAASILSLLFTRPIVTDYLKVGSQKTNVDALIGQPAVVTAAIDNVDGQGQIKVGGQIWSARSESGAPIPVGTSVLIRRIAGVCAYVDPAAGQ